MGATSWLRWLATASQRTEGQAASAIQRNGWGSAEGRSAGSESEEERAAVRRAATAIRSAVTR